MRKFIYLTVFLLLTLPGVALADADTVIDGVTEFLIERAKENNFYIFEQKLTSDGDFAKYFPNTYQYVSEGDLKVLLTSKSVWKKAVENDLATLVTRSFAESITREIDLSAAAADGMERYKELAQYLAIEIEGQIYPLNTMPMTPRQDIRDTINGFWEEPVALRDELDVLGKTLKAYADLVKVTPSSTSDLLLKAKALEKAFRNLDRLGKHIEAHKNQLRINTEAMTAIKSSISTSSSRTHSFSPDSQTLKTRTM